MIGMVKPIKDNSTLLECPEFANSTSAGNNSNSDAPYSWDTKQQGLVVSIYFIGYLIGMFPSGYFADR